jgi:hypothetical protein
LRFPATILMAATVAMLAACSSGIHAARSPTPGTRHAATRIVLADLLDQRATVVTLGRRATVSSLPLTGRSPGDPPVNLAATGGSLVFYGRDGTYAMPASFDAPSRRLHRGLYFIPSATSGRVWIAIQDTHLPDQRLVSRVIEVNVAGKTVSTSAHRPPTRNITNALRIGLVVQGRSDLLIWDPRTGRTLRTLPGVFPAATHGNLVAWCAHGCAAMHLTDALTGADRVVPRVGRHPWEETYGGSISPDGHYLALPIQVANTDQVALVDLRADTSRLIPASHLATVDWSLAWAPTGDTFYFTAGAGRIMRYQVGQPAATTLPVKLHGQFRNITIL